MQIDSPLNVLNGMYQSDATQVSDKAQAAPQHAQATTSERPFDSNSEHDWCELLVDITALANSGGGQIVVRGAIDEKEIVRRLANYTGSDFADVALCSVDSTHEAAVAITVGAALFPIGVAQAGSFHFRHGERSEPGTTADMRAFIERLLRRMRRRWLRGIRRALMRPIGYDATAAPKRTTAKRIRLERAVLQPVRIVSDPNAPALQPQDVDRLYPWRQKDLLQELNNRIGRRLLTTYDIQAVRRHHQLDERPDFVFHLPGAGRRYSPALADWILEQFHRDPDFFHDARVADQEMLKLRRQKPK
jgi:hypothetical protein